MRRVGLVCPLLLWVAAGAQAEVSKAPQLSAASAHGLALARLALADTAEGDGKALALRVMLLAQQTRSAQQPSIASAVARAPLGKQTPYQARPSAATLPEMTLPVTPEVPALSSGAPEPAAALETVIEDSFAQERGRLALPVPFSTVRESLVTGDGPALRFRAKGGSQVLASAAGRVAFSDGTSGRVILDHGGSYYTTYSGVQSPTVRVGDLVTARAPLGKVAPGGLTFEIRQGVRALEPKLWLGLN